jgi:hypothetical protein
MKYFKNLWLVLDFLLREFQLAELEYLQRVVLCYLEPVDSVLVDFR